jgi:small subunit ribosomal protein S8e
MGITRDSRHKRRATGGKRASWRKKRKFELGRQAASTKMGPKKVHTVRVRGGATKFRALRLDAGNFSWSSESVTNKARIMDVVYNASSNELVRTKTLVKGAVVQIDSTPFRQWYATHYGLSLGKKKDEKEDVKKSKHVQAVLAGRNKDHKLAKDLDEQFNLGRLYAIITSRPGQSGRCDGYILEDRELEFYKKKMQKKKTKTVA